MSYTPNKLSLKTHEVDGYYTDATISDSTDTASQGAAGMLRQVQPRSLNLNPNSHPTSNPHPSLSLYPQFWLCQPPLFYYGDPATANPTLDCIAADVASAYASMKLAPLPSQNPAIEDGYITVPGPIEPYINAEDEKEFLRALKLQLRKCIRQTEHFLREAFQRGEGFVYTGCCREKRMAFKADLKVVEQRLQSFGWKTRGGGR
jgi:hypothetical protein